MCFLLSVATCLVFVEHAVMAVLFLKSSHGMLAFAAFAGSCSFYYLAILYGLFITNNIYYELRGPPLADLDMIFPSLDCFAHEFVARWARVP
ncbi:hypothetical protein VNO77_44563 [Canavalia gladiata]|uniref:Uncharacterized protein n=1 Tax=Canavalia gladiata TaxID=3824 RepID=A0AAN9JWX7_CANGL